MAEENDITIGGERKFLPYNTGNEPLPMPEYGRTIQQMVDHCVMIPDREERTACAYQIIRTMKTLFPKAINDKRDINKFWDHLNIMARFELDIDFPVEVATKEDLETKPAPISVNSTPVRHRHYGRHLEEMVQKVADMENTPEKDILIEMLANQMKKDLMTADREMAVSDERVFRDLETISKGAITIDPSTYRLMEFEVTAQPEKGKKGKKKKKKNQQLI